MSKAKPHARRVARSRAFQVLYSLQFSASTSLGALRAAFIDMPDPNDTETETPDAPLVKAPSGFAWELVEGVWSNASSLDEVIGSFSQNWRVDRLGRVELTILRLALFEMLHRPDVPPKVALNEALELSARFGDEKSRRFINGILDSAIKALDNGALPSAAPRQQD